MRQYCCDRCFCPPSTEHSLDAAPPLLQCWLLRCPGSPPRHPKAGGKLHDCASQTLVYDLYALFPLPGRLVHRLDRDVSGAIVVARTPDAAAWLSAALASPALRLQGENAVCASRPGAQAPVAASGAQIAPMRELHWAVVWAAGHCHENQEVILLGTCLVRRCVCAPAALRAAMAVTTSCTTSCLSAQQLAAGGASMRNLGRAVVTGGAALPGSCMYRDSFLTRRRVCVWAALGAPRTAAHPK